MKDLSMKARKNSSILKAKSIFRVESEPLE